MKYDTTFVRMRSGDYLEDSKMSKKAPPASSNLNPNCGFSSIITVMARFGERVAEEGLA